MTYNQMTINLKLTRSEVCDLLLACAEMACASDAHKWKGLFAKFLTILDDFDEKNGMGGDKS